MIDSMDTLQLNVTPQAFDVLKDVVQVCVTKENDLCLSSYVNLSECF